MKTARKENLQDSLVETGKNLGSGIIGMVAGSALGRHSLWTGALGIFGGAWYQHDWLTSLGVGMVASNGFSSPDSASTAGIDGFQDELSNAKNRAISSLKALGKKAYIDKLSPSMGEKMGLGELEDADMVFLDGQLNDLGEFDTSEVDEIIHQLEEGNADDLMDQEVGFEGGDGEGEMIEGMEDSFDLEGDDEIGESIGGDEYSFEEETLSDDFDETTAGIGNMDILDLQGMDALELSTTA